MRTFLKKVFLASFFLGLFVIFAQAQAADVLDVIKMKSGTTGCSGNHFVRLGGTEDHFTVWNFRNFNRNRTVKIKSVRVYNANGTIIYNAPAIDSFPGGFNTVLAPHQSTQLRSFQIILGPLSRSQRPVQLEADWKISGGKRGLPPSIGRVRLIRDVITGAERSRHGGAGCSFLKFRN